MSEELLNGMDGCPFGKPETEFKYNEYDVASNLDIEFGVGVDAYKDECESYIDVNADLGGAYPLAVVWCFLILQACNLYPIAVRHRAFVMLHKDSCR